MTNEEIKKLRMNVGKFLHEYFIKYGEEKYEFLIEKIGKRMCIEYGEPFNQENLRIMEAEYVTLSSRINEKIKSTNKKDTDK